MDKNNLDVFISYARKDYSDATGNIIPDNPISAIRQRLDNEGLKYWFDEEGIYSGQNFVEKIVTNIENARIFLFLSTANANKSEWTCKEIAIAAEMRKPIIPVRIDNSPYNRKVMFRIADIDFIPFYNNPEKGMTDMVDAIKHHLAEIEEQERKQREEEERRKAEEKRKKEEWERRLAEEEKRRQEEQNQLVISIRLKCKELQTEGTKIGIEWNKLLLETDRITDETQREALKSLINESRPKDDGLLTAKLTKKIEELNIINSGLQFQQEELDTVKKQLSESEDKATGLRKQLDTIKKRRLKTHIFYWCIIFLLLLFFFIVIGSTNNKDPYDNEPWNTPIDSVTTEPFEEFEEAEAW